MSQWIDQESDDDPSPETPSQAFLVALWVLLGIMGLIFIAATWIIVSWIF